MSHPSGRRSRAFTLIELLVVITIIGIGIAIWLPATLEERRINRRAQCSNNMKQLGLALANYESAHGSLPMGSLTRGRADGCATYWGHTWLNFIMPFMEWGNVSNSINFSRPYNSVAQFTAFRTRQNAFLCPDDTPNVDLSTVGFIVTMQTSYAAMRGVTENLYYSWGTDTSAPNADRCGAIDSEGAFGSNISYRFADVADGTSNTIYAGEVSRFTNEPRNSVFNFGNGAGAFRGPDWQNSTAWSNDIRPTSGAFSVPRINAKAVKSNVTDCLTSVGPFAVPQYGNRVGWLNTCENLGQFGFRSNHHGVAIFLFGDGSVRLLKDTISLPTYRALSTRALGEAILQGSY